MLGVLDEDTRKSSGWVLSGERAIRGQPIFCLLRPISQWAIILILGLRIAKTSSCFLKWVGVQSPGVPKAKLSAASASLSTVRCLWGKK